MTSDVDPVKAWSCIPSDVPLCDVAVVWRLYICEPNDDDAYCTSFIYLWILEFAFEYHWMKRIYFFILSVLPSGVLRFFVARGQPLFDKNFTYPARISDDLFYHAENSDDHFLVTYTEVSIYTIG